MKSIGLFLVGALVALAASAAMFYESDQPGHGVDITQVGDAYTLTWHFHDGQSTRWIASDVCDYGEPCEVWTLAARAFPAVGAYLVEAGSIRVQREGDQLQLEYDLDVAQVACYSLPGPHPPECRRDDGTVDRSIILVPELKESGSLGLVLLAE